MSRDIIDKLLGLTASPSDNDRDVVKATKGKPTMIFPHLIKDYDDFVLVGEDVYMYNGKYFEILADADLKKFIMAFFQNNEILGKFNTSKSRELIHMIKYGNEIKSVEMDHNRNLMNLNNGVYDMENDQLLEHDRKYHFTYIIDVDYDPDNMNCPFFVKFLQGVFATKGSWDTEWEYEEDEYENALRMCGYLLYPKITKEIMFILLGKGSNGKSILMDVLQMFFPEKFTTYLSLSALAGENSFNREKLINSRINFCREAKGGKLDAEELKAVISGEGITIQRKFNTAVDMKTKLKVIVSANNMPYLNDTTHATIRRLVFFHFQNQFSDDAHYAKEVNPEKYRIFKQVNRDKMIEMLTKEKSAIFNLFLGGLKRFAEANWNFIPTETNKNISNEYREGSDTLGMWLLKHYAVGEEGDFIPVSEIYHFFKQWYFDNYSKTATHSTMSVGRKIAELFRISPIRMYNSARNRVTGYQLIEKDSELDKETNDIIDMMNIDNEGKVYEPNKLL